MNEIHYESLAKWKYRLTKYLHLQSSINVVSCKTEYIQIWYDGRLILSKGYAWDGPSGPTIDTKDSMAASAGHDALYQLIGMGIIHPRYRFDADQDLRRWCIEDGMTQARADAWYAAVRTFGGLHI